MTEEPVSTRANRINSDSLDWSYIGISVTVGHSTSVRRARERYTTDPPSTPDPMAADGQRYAASSVGRILQRTRDRAVVFGHHENESVVSGECLLPAQCLGVLAGRRHRRPLL